MLPQGLEITKNVQSLYSIPTAIELKLKNIWVGGKVAMENTTDTTASPTGHMTSTQAPVVCNKNVFHLFPNFIQPVKNYSLRNSN